MSAKAATLTRLRFISPNKSAKQSLVPEIDAFIRPSIKDSRGSVVDRALRSTNNDTTCDAKKATPTASLDPVRPVSAACKSDIRLAPLQVTRKTIV